jgi:hypothetical protein
MGTHWQSAVPPADSDCLPWPHLYRPRHAAPLRLIPPLARPADETCPHLPAQRQDGSARQAAPWQDERWEPGRDALAAQSSGAEQRMSFDWASWVSRRRGLSW